MTVQHDRRDTGYAWVVLSASLLVQFLVMGLTLSIGVLYVEWQDFFNKDTLVSWIASMSNSLVFMFGPLSTFLASVFGCRPVIFAGSLVSATGMVISFFASEPYQLILSYGVLVGIGSSLMYIPAVTAVPDWFAKYKNMAAGISVIGASVGSICYPPLLTAVIAEYTWRGGMLILAGLHLQVAFLATLLRDGDFAAEDTKNEKVDGEASSKIGDNLDTEAMAEERTKSAVSLSATSLARTPAAPPVAKARKRSIWAKRRRSIRGMTLIQFQSSTSGANRRRGTMAIGLTPGQIDRLRRMMQDNGAFQGDEGSTAGEEEEEEEEEAGAGGVAATRGDSVISTSYLKSAREQRRRTGTAAAAAADDTVNNNFEDRKSSVAVIEDAEATDSTPSCECVGVELLKHPSFYAFLIADMLWNIGMFMMYSVGPDFAVSSGVSKENAALLVTMASACGTVGQLLIGPVDACCHPNTLLLFTISVFGTAPFILLYALAGQSFALLSVWMSIYGLWSGLQNGVLPVVHSDYYESSGILGSAFGYVMLSDGLGGLVAPLLAARINTSSGSYNPAFYTGAATSFTAAVICLIVYLIDRRRRQGVCCQSCRGDRVDIMMMNEPDGADDGDAEGEVVLTRDRYGEVVVFSAMSTAACAPVKDGVAQTELSQSNMSAKLRLEFSKHRWRRRRR